jgi:NAD(P)H-quinone oxidoreductase subunit 5
MEVKLNSVIMYLAIGMGICPLMAMIINLLGWKNKIFAARLASFYIGIGWSLSLGALFFYPNLGSNEWLNFNSLNLLLVNLIFCVSFVVHRYSIRYMDGDRLYSRYFMSLAAITLSAIVMVLAEQVYLFWAAWFISNSLLVLLMIHKKEWSAARHSGYLSFLTLSMGSLCLLLALVMMSSAGASTSIDMLIAKSQSTLSMILLLIAALIQSAIWPFHRWLLSSLNSPTPISALMHAGLINGGGILIVKFAPLWSEHQDILLILFLLGAFSAMFGTICKLMQTDIKKMLACSTLAQMGFMMMQCGLGLFTAAIAHLCWHGLFKAYLFLSSGSALKQYRHQNVSTLKSLAVFFVSALGGVIAAISFAWITHKPIFSLQASTFVLFFAFMAGSQLVMGLIQHAFKISHVLMGIVLAACGGMMYGLSVHGIEQLLPHLNGLLIPQLSLTHLMVMSLFGALWVGFNIRAFSSWSNSRVWAWLYMNLLNSSQPASKTITALRNDYHC